MKTYRVTITGQQEHIKGNLFENQTEAQVNAIIEKYRTDDTYVVLFDGNSHELNNDLYIMIEEEK